MLLLLLACTDGDAKDTGDDAPVPLADAGVTIRGDAGDMAGSAVAAGDVDGDGADEIVAGALGGRMACVVAVPAAEAAMRDAPCLEEAQPYDFVGQAVAAGDLDGDGVATLVLGAPGMDVTAGADGPTSPDAGAVWLLDAAPTEDVGVSQLGDAWSGESAADAAGSFVAVGGDADGDALGDVLIGAPGSDRGGREGGAVYLVDGVPGSLAAADVVFVGGAETSAAKHAENVLGDGVGTAACAADLDGDGVTDVAIGAPGWDGGGDNAGAVAVYAGPVSPGVYAVADAETLLQATRAGGYAGGAVACGGDTNGDGVGELLVGADADGGGRVYVWRGGALDAGPVVAGEDGEQAGYVVAFVGDGVAIGLASSDTPATDAGGVAVFLGALAAGTHGVDEADARWAGTAAGDLAGTSLAAVRQADGAWGLAVGAPYNADDAPIGGAIYVVPLP